jgi:membrane protein DedA with SNARE-associated domain
LFEHFIELYGYYAVFAFACIEGEIAILTAGFLCRSGLMSLPMVIAVAFAGTLITEQSLFFVGRTHGRKLLEKYPKMQTKTQKIMDFLKKYNEIFIFGSRFIYGIRNISPIVIGMAGIHPFKFSSLNVPAAMLWSVVVAGAGYWFADVLESVGENMKIVQIAALMIFLTAVSVFVYRRSCKKDS